MLKIYDTMSRDLREFVPIEEGKVRMYVCGPTVYNYIHVGNARSTVAFDTIRRYFEYRGYEVAYISNFTDVDDKIINRAKEEGITPQEVADKYIAAFREDVTALGVKPATRHPRCLLYTSLQLRSFRQWTNRLCHLAICEPRPGIDPLFARKRGSQGRKESDHSNWWGSNSRAGSWNFSQAVGPH